jgi:putative copper export protein
VNGLTELIEHAGGAGAVMARAVSFTAIAGVVGAVVFRRFVTAPALAGRDALGPVERQAARVGLWCALALAIVAPVRVAMQAKGLAFEGDPWAPMIPRIVSTSWGHAIVWQFAAAIVAAAGFARSARAGGWWHAGVGGAVLAVTPALTGHAAAVESLRSLALAADVAHVIGASAWVGGLSLLTLRAWTYRGMADGGESLGAMIDRFHRVAQWAVGALVVSGGVAIWLHLRSPSDLTGSSYGRVLLVKLALVFVALGYGWRHSRTGAARARKSGPSGVTQTFTVEWVVLLVVLAVTGLLAGSPPPGTE